MPYKILILLSVVLASGLVSFSQNKFIDPPSPLLSERTAETVHRTPAQNENPASLPARTTNQRPAANKSAKRMGIPGGYLTESLEQVQARNKYYDDVIQPEWTRFRSEMYTSAGLSASDIRDLDDLLANYDNIIGDQLLISEEAHQIPEDATRAMIAEQMKKQDEIQAEIALVTKEKIDAVMAFLGPQRTAYIQTTIKKFEDAANQEMQNRFRQKNHTYGFDW